MSNETFPQLNIPVDGDVKPKKCERDEWSDAYKHPDAHPKAWERGPAGMCDYDLSGRILGESVDESNQYIALYVYQGHGEYYAEIGGTCYDVTLGLSTNLSDLYGRARELDLTVIQ